MTEASDRIELLGHSRIQHGPGNQRVYLMKADPRDLPGLPGQLDQLARANGYTKIFAKIPQGLLAAFEAAEYRREAFVPGFYRGQEAAAFMGRYLSNERRVEQKPELVRAVLATAQEKAGSAPKHALPTGTELRELGPADANAMSDLYRAVFPTYPFPVHDPAYLQETMRTHIRYFGVIGDGKLMAVSSGEMDRPGRNAEMTDFAALPAARGAGLALHLLRRMEAAMREEGVLTLFTIARAYSHGINVTFARGGYTWGGTLTNNTQISGRIESMNVWHKRP